MDLKKKKQQQFPDSFLQTAPTRVARKQNKLKPCPDDSQMLDSVEEAPAPRMVPSATVGGDLNWLQSTPNLFIRQNTTATCAESTFRFGRPVTTLPSRIGRMADSKDMPLQVFKTIYVELTAEQKQRIKEISGI